VARESRAVEDAMAIDVHEVEYRDTGPPGEGEEELLEELARAAHTPAEDIMVTTSVRLPVRLHRQLRAFAKAHDTTTSDLIRAWIELHTAEEDRQISLGDALRALASLRPAA
jgi:predicted DNA-binding protein